MLSLGFTELYSDAHIAQLVEHILGKDEVTGSIPVVSSNIIKTGTVYARNYNFRMHRVQKKKLFDYEE